MPAYVISEVEVRDRSAMEAYRALAAQTIAQYGGRYLARGGALTTYEGDWQPPRIVLIEFPSQQAWDCFYYGTEYEAIKPMRDEVSTGRMIGVEGLPPGQPATQAPRPQAVGADHPLPEGD